MRALFGTDGIRGKADGFPLDDATMFALGAVLARRLAVSHSEPLVLLGMDTRESGPRIATALAAGLSSGGGRSRSIGIVPTPAVAYLCRVTGAAAGISISASHNPYDDNGVKIFGSDGMKLSDALEKKIEDELLAAREETTRIAAEPPLRESPELIERYEEFLVSSVASGGLSGRTVVLDTGYGAASRIAPEVFRRTGASVTVINDQPNGRNINLDSGALHPGGLAERVIETRADLGIAFDGDADRAIFVDDRGRIRNGDEILYLWARREQRLGRLPNHLVVATIMSNFGFEKKLGESGIRLLRAAVGDKYVLEMMVENGATLGGEQSGHIIDLTVHTTGDGLHTGLVISELLAGESSPFSGIETFDPMPQILLNERVSAQPPLDTLVDFQQALLRAESRLADRGRIVVRYSGTENLVRVMVEGESQEEISAVGAELVAALRAQIG
ncbi:MAG TPA: phosphoglucosamine mutase [Thermoanaerobaculia bacterium]|nr:phosphoglucosamine mutase [Thermoanaerobaculia bacterium]